jgi:hypothetical protein
MPNSIIVLLNDLHPAAQLEGTGEVVQSNGESVLKGPFRLVVATKPSDTVDFHPTGLRATVEQNRSSWRLKRLVKTSFRFSTPLRLQSAPSSPWLECKSAWLIQPAKADAMPLLSLDESSVSLDGGAPSAGTGTLIYPTKTGVKSISLEKPLHPEDPSWAGFFVLPFEGGHAVRLGTVKQQISLDHAVATDVVVDKKCDLLLRLPAQTIVPAGLTASGNEAALIFDSAAPNALRVRTTTNSGVMMAAGPNATEWTRVNIDAKRLEAAGGWLRSVSLRAADLLLGQVASSTEPVAGATSLFTSTERLQCELALPQTGGSAGAPAARLISRSSLAQAVAPTDRRSRYYGLRVQGLGSRSGLSPVLDSDLIVFDFDPDRNGAPKFFAKAGVEVIVGDSKMTSRLVPKLDPNNPNADRSLHIPVGHELALHCTASAVPAETTFRLDTSSRLAPFAAVGPQLVSAPVGMSARGAMQGAFARWSLGLAGGKEEVSFEFTSGALSPIEKEKWLNPFTTIDPLKKFGLLEHPGTEIVVDGPSGPPRTAAAGTKRTKTEITTIKANGEEIVAYSAFFTILSFATTYCFAKGFEQCLDEKTYKVSFPELTDATTAEYVKSNGLRDLRVVYFACGGASHAGAVQGIRAFIDDNMRGGSSPTPPKFHWSFTMGLSILLFETTEAGQERYCDEIVAVRKPTAKPGLAFDFSTERGFEPQHLGWSHAEWKKLAEESPALWPRGSGRDGARLDPSDSQWRGTMFRDMPLFVPTRPVLDDFPFLKKLIEKINDKLVLDYGWRDEAGHTWVGGLSYPDPGERFTPDSWASMLEMFLMQVRIKGAAGKVVTAEGICRIRLPRIKKKDTQEPLELIGTFGLDLESGENPITRIDITQDGAPIETESIPGFSHVGLRRIATDLRTAQLELLLTATPELANALPILSSDRPQQAFLAFDFGGEPNLTISLALPSEIETNLFGRWPLTLQAMSLRFERDLSNVSVELRIRGRLNLGISAFGSIGAELVITRRGNGQVDLDVEINEIAGSLSVASLKVTGSLKWATKDGKCGLVKLTNAGQAGKERELWGSLTVEDPGVIGRNMLAVRIGNRGEASYWIASIESSAKIPFGIAELRNPALLLGHRVDLAGGLSRAIFDPTGSILALLRPPTGKINDWLASWEPSADVGTVIAGSGYLHFQDQVASAPVKDGTVDPQKLSSIIVTDTGLLRIDGVAAMLDVATLRFGVAIDYKKKRILVGLQAPTISYPTPENPQYVIQAGYITLGVGFKDELYLRLSIGWPERIGGTEFERDWTKATKVYMASMFPINTFWGGYLAELKEGRVVFGFAVRAGWTWSYEAKIGGVAKGAAELGITLGGVFQFAIAWGGAADGRMQLLASPVPTLPNFAGGQQLALDTAALAPHAAEIAAAMAAMEESLSLMAGIDLQLTAEIFGDIWGKASVDFLGVTLVAISVRAYARFRVCGTLNRGITQAKAQVGFEVSIKILCVTYSASAQIDIVLIDGDCPLLMAVDRLLLPENLPLALAAPRPR